MGINGKFHKFKLSFHWPSPSRAFPSSSSAAAPPPPPPPPLPAFLCPICNSLISDPVSLPSSGLSFDRVCVNICISLRYTPAINGSRPDLSTVSDNPALKTAILDWCKLTNSPLPEPKDSLAIEKILRRRMMVENIRPSEVDLLNKMADSPDCNISHPLTELNHRVNPFDSSSSVESVVITASPPLPFATRPASYFYQSSSSESPFSSGDSLNPNSNPNPNSEDEEFVIRLKSCDIYEQEQGVISLRKTTRSDEHSRISLCTPRLLLMLRSLLSSKYVRVQTNAVAALVNLSLEKSNKIKIVRSGIVPTLIDVLRGGSPESQEHAAGALFSLSLEDDNKTAIGVLGGLPPLLHALRSESERTCHDSAMALYHLTLVHSNRVKVVKLGAVPVLIGMVRTAGDLAGKVLLVLCNLAACTEGRAAMLDANVVEHLVGMLRREEIDSESTRENCVAALYSLSHGSMRFKGLAKEARAVEVLKAVEERGGERAREKARRILMILKGREEADEEVDWAALLESGTFSRTHHHIGGGGGGGGKVMSE